MGFFDRFRERNARTKEEELELMKAEAELRTIKEQTKLAKREARGAKINAIKTTGKSIGKILIIFLIIGGVIFYFSWNTAFKGLIGKNVEEHKGGVLAFMNNFDLRSKYPSLFKGFDILTGKEPPEKLWESQVIYDDYVSKGAEKTGVKITNLRSLRDAYYITDTSPETTAYITGSIQAIPFPDKNIFLKISAKDSNGNTWSCDPSSVMIDQAYGRTFLCNRTETVKDNNKEINSKSVTTYVTFSSDVAAGMNLYAINGNKANEIRSMGEDPLTYFKISKDELKAWRIPKIPVELGLGIEGNDLLEVYDSNNLFDLKISVKNVNPGILKKINDLTLKIENVKLYENINDFEKNGDKYKLKSDVLNDISNITFKNSEGKTFDFFFTIDSLGDEVIKEIPVQVELNYEYEYKRSVPIIIKNMIPEESITYCCEISEDQFECLNESACKSIQGNLTEVYCTTKADC